MEQINEEQVTFKDVCDLAKDDFKSFVEQIVGLDNQPFHNDIDDNLGHPLHRKIAISFPRGHGKSTHLSVAYPLWRIAKNHNLRILIISATAAVSKSFLSEIIGHVDRNEKYRQFSMAMDPSERGVIPRMKNYSKMKENWSGDSITIERGDLNMKDATIQAVGLFGSILSKRADVIICDDIVNQENSATEDQRQKTIDWIYTTVMPVLIPGGTFIYLGNTWHQDDLVARLLKDPQFDYKKKMPAIESESTHPELWNEWAGIMIDEGLEIVERRAQAEEYYLEHKAEMDEGVKVLWPDRYSYKELYMMRLANPYAFARMYQCDPSNRPNQKFRDEWLEKATKKGAKLRLQKAGREDFSMALTTEGLDLAIGEEDQNDDTAFVTLDRVKYSKISEVKPGDIVLRYIERGKMSPNTVRETIKSDYENVKPDGFRVETVGYQESIQRDLDEAGIPLSGYHTGGEKKDPFIGINSIAIYFELGKVVLPYDQTDPYTILKVSELINEMRAFPDGHTGDSLMAFWFAFTEMRDLLGGRMVIPTTTKDPLLVDPPDLSDPVIRAREERKADLAISLEQRAEQENFKRMMGR